MAKPTDKAPFQFDAQPMTKAYAEHLFRFCPCGFVPEGRLNTTIYVRYKKTRELSYDQPIRVVNASDRWVHFDCPDRELMFTRDGLTLGGDRAFNTPDKTWDKAVHLNVASIMGNDLAFDRFMINTHGFGEKNMPNLRNPKVHATTAKVIMQDCFVKDTLIFTDRGLMDIKSLVGRKKGKTPYYSDIRVLDPTGALNLPRKRFRSEKPASVYTLTTKSGHRVTCSEGQMFMTDKGWAKVTELSDTNSVHRTFGENIWSKEDVKFDFTFKDYVEDRFAHYPEEVECPVCRKNFQKLDSHLSVHGLRVSKLKLEYTMSRESAVSHSIKKSKNTVTIPKKMTPEFAELLGYIVADGSFRDRVRVSCGVKHDLAHRIAHLYKQVFNDTAIIHKIDPSKSARYRGTNVQPTVGVEYLDVELAGGLFLSSFLEYVGLKKGGANKQIPWSILQSTEPCMRAFLIGLFSADGSVNAKNGLPGIYSCSRNMILHLNAVLNNYGILTYVRHKDNGVVMPDGRLDKSKYGGSLRIRGKYSIFLFNSLVKLTHAAKADAQEKFLRKHANLTVKQLRAAQKGMKNIAYSSKTRSKGLLADPIISVKKNKEKKTTYDLTMNNEMHWFTAGSGFVAHNSGGFQIAHGALDFINPYTLAESYWNNADEGIVLDLPPRQLSDDADIIKAVAQLHRLNAKAMDPNLPQGFRFGNVLHGLHIDQVDLYRNLVEKDPIDYSFLCIAGALRFNIVETAHRCLHIIMQGRQYPHYHLLGVGNPTLIALLSQMAYSLARMGKHVLMTADASSPIGFALNRAAYVHPVYYDSFSPIRFGERMTSDKNYPGGSLPNAFKRFATSDQVAQAVGGYSDLIHLYNSSMVQAPIIYSNQVQLSNYVLMMGEYAKNLNPKEYRELCMLQFHGSKHCVLLGVALDYIEYAMQFGLKKAFGRYAHYMPAFTGAKTLKPFASLLGDEGSEEEATEVNKARFKGVIQNFLHFHKTGKEPEEKNKYKKKSTGKSNWLMV